MTRSLADDEAALAGYAAELADAVGGVAADWMLGLIERFDPSLALAPDVRAAMEAGAAVLDGELRTLLGLDLDEQRLGPLELLRRAVRFPTAVLRDAGVPPATRDEFSVRNFPDDAYALTPGSFAEVHPTLHEPGLHWGAAKAHVHLRRRREAAIGETSSVASRVVALSSDLMDASKITAAFPDAVIVRAPARLVQEATTATLVLVDLARLSDPAALLAIDARIVAFGSHVDHEALAAAEAAGAEALPRSVFFRRLESGDL